MQASLTLWCNWLEVHHSKLGYPLQWKRQLKLGSPPMQGLRICTGGHLCPSVLWWVGEVCLLPHQIGEHWTPMLTPLQARLQAISIDAGATEGVGRRSGWYLQDWICHSSSQLIQGQR